MVRRKASWGEPIVANGAHTELQLEPIRRLLPGRWQHHPGVVDQQIDRPALSNQPLGESHHRCEVGQVERIHPQPRARNGLPDGGGRTLRLIPDGQHQFGAGAGQADGKFPADAIAGPGNDGDAAVQLSVHEARLAPRTVANHASS
jgi:hypothetical protein